MSINAHDWLQNPQMKVAPVTQYLVIGSNITPLGFSWPLMMLSHVLQLFCCCCFSDNDKTLWGGGTCIVKSQINITICLSVLPLYPLSRSKSNLTINVLLQSLIIIVFTCENVSENVHFEWQYDNKKHYDH